MKRFAIIVAVVVAVLAIAVAAVPFVVPSDFLKQRVADRIAALTGRTVTFSGETSLSIYPDVAISIDGLSIGNPPDMGSDPFIVADSLHTRLRFLPLLIGRAEFDEFELVKPTVHLVVDNDGRWNWRIAGSAVAEQAVAAPASQPGTTRPPEIQIGRLRVDNGTILYDDLVSDTREQMTEVDLDINWPSLKDTASGRGKAIWRGETIEFTGLLAAPLQLFSGGTSPARFAIASTPLRASFSGRASGWADLRLDGEASVSTPSMRRTIEWLGTPMGTGPILGAAAVRGMVSIGGRAISFSSATIELDGNSAEGALSVSFAGARPAVQGTLATNRLDLSAYVEAGRADLAAEGSWLIAPARLPFAEAVDADVRLSAGELAIGATSIGKTAATVTINEGRLDVAVGEAQLYTGNMTAHFAIGAEGETMTASAETKFINVPALVALANLAGIAALDGATTANFDLTARGRTWGEFAQSIAGSGTIAIANGGLGGIDLNAIAERLANPFTGPVAAGGGTTTFPHLAADVTIAAGAITTEDLTMEGNGFRLTLDGRGSLVGGAIDASGILTTSTDTIPLSIAGTWRQPVLARRQTQQAPPAPGGG